MQCLQKYFSVTEETDEINLADTIILSTRHNLTRIDIEPTVDKQVNIIYWHYDICNTYFSDGKRENESILKDTMIPKFSKFLEGANQGWAKGIPEKIIC